jgi:putative hydrolase of the HAD superfamily
VLWDFGGVMTESPFPAFRRFEMERGLPANFLRGINASNHDDNAWARFERSELSPREFDEVFAAETRAAGHEVRGLEVVDPRDALSDQAWRRVGRIPARVLCLCRLRRR